MAKPFCFWKLNWKISFELSVTRNRFEGSRYAVLAEYKIFLSMNHSSYMFLLFKSSSTFSSKYLQQREDEENCNWKNFLTLITKDAVAQIIVCVWLHEWPNVRLWFQMHHIIQNWIKEFDAQCKRKNNLIDFSLLIFPLIFHSMLS